MAYATFGLWVTFDLIPLFRRPRIYAFDSNCGRRGLKGAVSAFPAIKAPRDAAPATAIGGFAPKREERRLCRENGRSARLETEKATEAAFLVEFLLLLRWRSKVGSPILHDWTAHFGEFRTRIGGLRSRSNTVSNSQF